MADRQTLAQRVGLFQMILKKSGKAVPRNRAEARMHIRGRGPHLPLTIRQRESNRRVSTRQKRNEQRKRAGGE